MGLIFFSCKKNTIITNSSAKLDFSQTSIQFDTVFTTVGSTVQGFLVRNNHNQPIVISNIKLVGNYTSPFRINVDGTPGTNFSNVKIPANDSIFVFVTVTIDPNNKNNPIVVEDSLQFTTNGNLQYVYLQAYGQDAYFHRPDHFPPVGPAYSIAKCGDVWTNDKPHVIFGYFVVDSACMLTMQAGTKVCMHNNAVLWVYKDGTLNIQGSSTSPVTIQGDRLEPAYSNVPGQWGEIWLSPGSINNYIQWAVIKNGTIGIEADTVGNTNPTLNMRYTIIKSMSNYGLLAQGSYVVGDDDLVCDCANYCVALALGGKYQFAQCTFANDWSYSQRQTPLLLINNWYQDVTGKYQSRSITEAYFGNCILYGTQDEEIGLDSAYGGSFNFFFEACNLKTKRSTPTGFHYSNWQQINSDPQFYSRSTDDYTFPFSSPCAVVMPGDSVNNSNNYLIDLNGTVRPSKPYNLGAYTAQ